MTDLHTLVERAQLGDSDAFDEIVLRFQDMVFGLAYSKLGDPALAQDAAQDAFIGAFKGLQSLSELKAFPGWLRRIVIRSCNRLIRENKMPSSPLDLMPDMASSEAGPAMVAEQGQIMELVHKAIMALPEGTRTVTTLYYIDGYSQNDISDFMELPVTTIKNRLHASRDELKKSIWGMLGDAIGEKRPSRNDNLRKQIMQIIQPDERKHDRGVYDVVEPGWEKSDRPECVDGRIKDSHYDWATSRIAIEKERIVAVWSVYDVTMRIGTATVRAAGVNCAAGPDRSTGGILERTALKSLDAMRREGYDITITFDYGEEFYRRLGYSIGWPELHWFLDVESLPPGPFGLKTREFAEMNELPKALVEMYNHENRAVTGTAVRPTYRRSKHPGLTRGVYWLDEDGNPAGYLMGGFDYNPERFWYDEGAGDLDQRLRLLRVLAEKAGTKEVFFCRLPYMSALGRRLRTMEGCRIVARCPRYMIAILNVRALFTKLAPELSRRLKASHLADWSGSLSVCYNDERITLRIEKGLVSVATGGQAQYGVEGRDGIVALVVGSEEPKEVLKTSGLVVMGECQSLLEVLFPKEHPQMANHDL